MGKKEKKRKSLSDIKLQQEKLQALLEMKEGYIDSDLRKKYENIGQEFLKDDVPKRLDPRVKKDLETILSLDSDRVRIHTGEKAQIAAEAMEARAFAIGDRDIYFGRGQFSQSTLAGKSLIAHEMSHLADRQVGFGRSMTHGGESFIKSEKDADLAAQLAYDQASDDESEQENKKGSEPEDVSTEGIGAAEESAQDVINIDKRELEDMVWEILDRQMRRDRERSGNY